MSPIPETSPSSSLPIHVSSFTADEFRRYEQMLNSTKSSSVEEPSGSHHASEKNRELPHLVSESALTDLSVGAWIDDLPSTNQNGGFTADEFRRYENALSDVKPVMEPARTLQPGASITAPARTMNPAVQVTEPSPVPLPLDNLTLPAKVLSSGDSVRKEKSPRESSSTSTSMIKSPVSSSLPITAPEVQLPNKRQARPIRVFRHTAWNVYKRLFSIVFIANAIALILYLRTVHHISTINIWHLATAASANILVATAIRQDYIQGIIYQISWLLPHSAPLRMRRIIAKVYENGGVHSGCGVAGTIWFTALTVILFLQFDRGIFTAVEVLVLTCILEVLLLMIVVFAYPALRFKSHNTFEITHRFAGWTIIIIFWVELGLIARVAAQREHISAGLALVEQPSFWFLVLITIHTILPWLNLRRWQFESERLSTHAVRLYFKQTVGPFTGIAISISPLYEWHPFATMPSLIGESSGGSLIVSTAGDWTKETVKNPRKYYWVKGIPKPGVLSMCLIFKRVVIVTTGSGIGPCLSIMASPHRRTECRVLWSCPDPEGIFGTEIVDCVRRADNNAIIINSRASGRPDMVALTYKLFVESNAEAVFVISNPALTRKIVYGMETRGVPAFGPIWDS